MDRRHFISSLAACFYTATFFKYSSLYANTALTSDKEINTTISGIFSNIESAKVVGQHYLDDYPSHANKEILLHDSGINSLDKNLTNQSKIKELLLKKQQTDFQNGDTVTIDHWVLSRSEASLCALLLLS